ncbi:MAG: hypothetical protein IPK50_02945 [Fibrobacterota bacterium]|nr:MAG: hypothetical protein IPK50_02945 [Fibrobacterota bacterium]
MMNVENTIYTRIGVPLREERQMINRLAMREAVVNAIVHNDYSNSSVPKFEFFSDRLEITSAGGLPHGLDKDDFFAGHSAPRNKEIMRVFRDLEIVEHLGSGIPRILEAYGKEAFTISRNFVRLVFPYAEKIPTSPGQPATQSATQSAAQSPTQSANPVDRLVMALQEDALSSGALRERLQLSHRQSFRENYLHAALERDLIEMTIPDKPSSRLQQYRLTPKGRRLLKNLKKDH